MVPPVRIALKLLGAAVYTGRLPFSSRQKMPCKRLEISLLTSNRFIILPEPVGHSKWCRDRFSLEKHTSLDCSDAEN
jgi:hypothetical protein